MTRLRRWCVVALGVALLAAVPVGLRLRPVADNDISAARLLAQVRGSYGQGWSGYIETDGTLQLPDAGQFSDLASFFGTQTRMRAWWSNPDDWRVDRLLAAGEDDLVHAGDLTTEWDYERARATVSRDPAIRLPRSADLVPPQLAHRFLRGVTTDDVARLPAERIAGTDAPGLRVTPPTDVSSIDHLDLWADPGSGVPLRVEVYAGSKNPAFTSSFRDFSHRRPAAADVAFTPTPSTEVRYDDVLDIADAANQYAPLLPPDSAAGLAKSPASDGAVGVYGQGMAQVIAIPLRGREARALRDQLEVTPGVEQSAGRTSVMVGPLGVVLTGEEGDGGWLLAGTLDHDALLRAGDDVSSGFSYVGDGERLVTAVISTEGLTKRYGRIAAVDALDLDVREGDVYGFLGANGSGKTTTIRMLLGLVLATSGRMEVLGRTMPGASREVLPQVGALVEGPAAYPHLSGRRNLALFDAMGRGSERSTRGARVEEALERVGLAGVDRRPVRAYSLGMRQRLGLAGALLQRPRLLVLDEPTNGLDPQGIHEIRQLLLDLNAAGTTVFLSSHLLAEIEQMCTRVGVLDGGRLVLQDDLAELQRPTGRVEVHTPDVAMVRRLLDGVVEEHDTRRVLVRDPDPAALNARLVAAGVRVTALAAQRHRLEDVVLAATSAGSDSFATQAPAGEEESLER